MTNLDTFKNLSLIGVGIRRKKNGKTLDVFYPVVLGQQPSTVMEVLSEGLQNFENGVGILDVKAVLQHVKDTSLITGQWKNFEALGQLAPDVSDYFEQDVIFCGISDLKAPVSHAEEGYLRLHAISKKLYKPHGISLEGVFGQLTNVAWSSVGPLLPEDVDQVRISERSKGNELSISHIDKFPYLVNYIVPEGVRIASGSQVRLGAYLGEGTTVMPAGYVNFNAGTEGPAMVEGRISAGVFVGANSDLGGGASVMGTLSGGNAHVISIGEHCLIGANAGTGISLGNGCTIAAGLYIYAGMKVSLYDAQHQPVDLDGTVVEDGQNIVKAKALSGKDYLLFIQDSQTGQLRCYPNQKQIELNASLHHN